MAGGDGFAMSGMFEGGQQVRALEHSKHRTCTRDVGAIYWSRDKFLFRHKQRSAHSIPLLFAQFFVLSMGFAKNVGRHSFSTIMKA